MSLVLGSLFSCLVLAGDARISYGKLFKGVMQGLL